MPARLTFPNHRPQDAMRLVDAYHGTTAATASEVVATQLLRPSRHSYDWLGHGSYFWEESPRRAEEWAYERAHPPQPTAVVQAEVRLGRCLNLLDTRFLDLWREAEALWEEGERTAGRAPAENVGKRFFRNCAVVNFLCDNIDPTIDTVRAAYNEGPPITEGAGIFAQAHVHLCVRNPACIVRLSMFDPSEATSP